MINEIKEYFEEGKMHLDESMDHLRRELSKIRTGKASTSILQGLMVEYYGTMTPLSGVSTISTSDARTLVIQPWEKSMLAPIERSIFEANLGLTPMNDGELIRISIPPLTEERRVQLAKQARALGEDGKVSLRSTRHKLMDFVKKAVKDGFSEDDGKRKEEEADKLIKQYSEKIDTLIVAKEKDIMTV